MANSVTGRGLSSRAEKPPHFSPLACTLLVLLGFAGLGAAILGAWNNNAQIVYIGGGLGISAVGIAVCGRHFTPAWPKISGSQNGQTPKDEK